MFRDIDGGRLVSVLVKDFERVFVRAEDGHRASGVSFEPSVRTVDARPVGTAFRDDAIGRAALLDD